MRKKTSLTLDPESMPLARACAADEGLDIGRWIDRAIRHEAALRDAAAIEAWLEAMPDEEKAITADLEAADR